MIQHHFCLYCSKKLHDYYACTCEASKLKWYITKPEPIMPEIKPIHRADLLFVANELPKIPNMNHEAEILRRYTSGGWDSVDQYVTAIQLYVKNPFVTSLESRRDTICQKTTKWLTNTKKSLISKLNNIDWDKVTIWLYVITSIAFVLYLILN